MSNSFKERLKELRERKGLTQKELADILNVSDKVVSKWENGNSEPDNDVLIKMSELFNTTLDYLLKGSITLKEVDAISKIELACREDNIALLDGVDLDSFDSSGKNIDYYANYYDAKKIKEYLHSIDFNQKVDAYEKEHITDKMYYVCGLFKNETNIDNLRLLGASDKRSDITEMCSEFEQNGFHSFKVYTCATSMETVPVDYCDVSMHVLDENGKDSVFISWHLLDDNKSAIVDVKYASEEPKKRRTLFANEKVMKELFQTLQEIDLKHWENRHWGCPITNISYFVSDDIDIVPILFYVKPNKEQYMLFVKAIKKLFFEIMFPDEYKLFLNEFNDSYGEYYRLNIDLSTSTKLFKRIEEEEKAIEEMKKYKY